jgi:DNA repair protein RadC
MLFFPTVVSKFNNCVNKRNWITKELKIQCQLQRDLYLLTRNSNNTNAVNYCKTYCKLLSKNITEAKKEYYNNLIIQSKNKIATTWKIIKSETNNTYIRDNITEINVKGTMTCNPQIIADAMNQHFLLLLVIW